MEFVDLILQQMFRRYPELAAQGISSWKWQSSGKARSLEGPGHKDWAVTLAPMLDHYESGGGRDGSTRYFETEGAKRSGGGWFDW